MNKKQSRLRIRIFCAMLIVPTLLWGIFSIVGVTKVLDYDTGEKRNKHEIAEGTNLSNITEELESCYDDRVPFRSLMLSINSTITWLTELPYTKVIEPVLLNLANASMNQSAAQNNTAQTSATGNGTGSSASSAVSQEEDAGAAQAAADAGTEISTDPAADGSADTQAEAAATVPVLDPTYETPQESGYYPYKELCPEVIQGRDNWLFTTETYPDFIGSLVPTDEEYAEKLTEMDQLNQICQSKGIELHIVAVPNKNTVYPEYMPSVDETTCSAVKQLEDYVHANSAVSFNFLDDEMLGAKVYGRLYYMHDTHWNNRGGLAAYAYIRNILGMSPIDIGSIEAVDTGAYTGDLVTYTGLPEASFVTEDSVEMQYKTDVPQTLVRGDDDYIDEVTAQNTESDKTVVVVGDSYRHSLLPYFSRDFAHFYSLNETQLNSEMADILNSADIIVVEEVQRNFFFEHYFDQTMNDMISLLQ